MKTTQVEKDGEIFTVVVHRAEYSLGKEKHIRTIDVATNLPGIVTAEEIDLHTSVKQLQKIKINVREAIRVMNDDFVEVLDKINPFTLHSIELIDQPV